MQMKRNRNEMQMKRNRNAHWPRRLIGTRVAQEANRSSSVIFGDIAPIFMKIDIKVNLTMANSMVMSVFQLFAVQGVTF